MVMAPGNWACTTPVQLFQKIDRFQILTATEFIGYPLPFLARIIEVEHGGHGVDAHAVHMKLLEPIQSVGEQEIAHLVAAIIIDEGAPVRVLTLARVFVLIERRAVETPHGPFVLWEMAGNPVKNDAHAFLMATVHKLLELVGRPETRGGGVHVARLVSPSSRQGDVRPEA